MVQYLVLESAAHCSRVVQWSDVVGILEALEACEILSSSDSTSLKEAYPGVKSSVHRVVVSNATDGDAVEANELMEQASSMCTRLLPNL